MKKVLSIILVLVLALSIAACTNAPTPGKTTSGQSQGNKEQPEPTEKPTLAYLSGNAKFDIEKDVVKGVLEECTGYKIEPSMLPADKALETLNLQLSSGTVYDVMLLQNEFYRSVLGMKMLMPLNDLIDEYGPNIKAGISQELWDSVSVGGVIYGIPAVTSGIATYGLALRKDILDELSLEMPNTPDQLYAVAKTIKEKKGIIPITASSPYIPQIASGFGVSREWDMVDGNPVPRIKQKGMKEYVAFMKKLYDEGLLDPEIPVNKDENVLEKLTTGKAAFATLAWWSGSSVIPALNENHKDSELVFLQPLQDANGKRHLLTDAGVDMMTSIHKNSKNAIDTIKFIDAIMDEENFENIAIGKEGVDFKVENEKYIPILPAFNDNRGNSRWYLAGVISEKWPAYWRARVAKDANILYCFNGINQGVEEYGESDLMSNTPSLEKWAKYSRKLSQLETDEIIKIIAGDNSLEAFDSLLKAWDTEGGTEVTNEISAHFGK